MTRLCERLAWPALALALAAALPVWAFELGARRHDDCADPQRLREVQSIEGTGRHRELPAQYRRGDIQMTRGNVPNPAAGRPLRFQIVRSHEPAPLYNSPTRYVFHHVTPEAPTELRWLEVDGEKLPVHWRSEVATSVPLLIQYFYVFGGRPVQQPFLASLASLATQLRHGTLPLTLVLVHGANERSTIEAMRSVADDWLIAAWKHYDESCNP